MKKRILSLMTALVLAAALCIPAAAADSSTLPFTDVPQTYWAYQSILFSYQNNLVKGKTETTFQPESPMTIGQYLTVLYRIGSQLDAGYPEKATTGAN
jgi:S-layer homology domain.